MSHAFQSPVLQCIHHKCASDTRLKRPLVSARVLCLVPLQPYAELFGLRCNIPTSHILNFSEEVVRDQALFVGSLLAAELEPRLRQAAGASSWQVRPGTNGLLQRATN